METGFTQSGVGDAAPPPNSFYSGQAVKGITTVLGICGHGADLVRATVYSPLLHRKAISRTTEIVESRPVSLLDGGDALFRRSLQFQNHGPGLDLLMQAHR